MGFERVEFQCPFCGRDVEAVDGPAAHVVHLAPACRQFVDLEPDKFLKAARLARGISAPWDKEAS